MATANTRKVVKIFQNVDNFVEIYIAHEFAFAFRDICELTAFFSPSIRKVNDEFHIKYELGLTVIDEREDLVRSFKKRITNITNDLTDWRLTAGIYRKS